MEQLPLPLVNPERIVLITRNDSRQLAEAWDAGIVSVVCTQDPMSTVLLAIMAAGLRVDKPHSPQISSGISPTSATEDCAITPRTSQLRVQTCKTQ